MNNHKEIKPTAVSMISDDMAGFNSFACSQAVAGNFIMPKKIEYVPGQLINGLVFIREVEMSGAKRKGRFVCQFCGNGFNAQFGSIRFGSIVSCGCWNRFISNKKNSDHGLYKHKLYSVWTSMKQRCYNPKNNKYHVYGALGITVCDEWLSDFKAYYDCVMSLPHAMEDGYSIDRKHTDDGYKPENLRWADIHTQNANKLHFPVKYGYIGIRPTPNGYRWSTRITIHSKGAHIKTCNTKQEAVEARNNYIKENELWEYPIQTWRG